MPPFAAGAVKLTVAVVSPGVAVTPVGAPGTTLGVTALEAPEAGPVPDELAAVTLKVYCVPAVRPVMVCVSAVVPPLESEPATGLAVTVYPVTAVPPFAAGAVKLTLTDVAPKTVAVHIVGAPGTRLGVTALEAPEAGPVPAALVAVTANVYAVPLVKPFTVIGLVALDPV